jgi:hypothetical protein
VGDGGLTEKNFTATLKTKLDGIEEDANNYIHPSLNHIPSGGAVGNYLKYSSSGTAQWAELPEGLELGITETTAYRGDYGNIAYIHSQTAHAPSNADNTALNETSHANVVVDEDFGEDGFLVRSGFGSYTVDTNTYLTAETDPIFTASQAFYITNTDILNLGNLSGTNTGDQSSSDFTHNNLTGLNEGTYLHLTSTEKTNAAAGYTHSQIVSGNPHQVNKGDIGLSNVTNDAQLKVTQLESTITNDDTKIPTSGAVVDYTSRFGNMFKSTYDTNNNGIVDKAESVDDGVNSTSAAHIKDSYTHISDVTNPHNITKTQVGLSNVPNTDFTSDVNANTTHRNSTTNPHSVTKTQINLENVDNTSDLNKPISTATQSALDDKADATDLTSHTSNTANPHSVTKSQVGLGDVPNTDFTSAVSSNTAHRTSDGKNHSDVVLNNTHRGKIDNPHNVTKSQVGLSNVPNIDCTNATNITSGTLPSAVLPPIAITDTYTATSESGQLALTVQKGDICVRTDLNKSYISKDGTNTSLSD